MLDLVFAIIVAIIIAYTGLKLTGEATKGLLDAALPQEDLDILDNILKSHVDVDIIEVKISKTRKAGSEKLIELVIVVNKRITVKTCHDICNNIENEIMQSLPGAKVFIHMEPCEK